MSNTLQDYLVCATEKAATDLEAALLRLPEDKRDWSPMGKARTALDMVAECALLGATTVDIIKTRAFPADHEMAAFELEKADLAKDWPKLRALLYENNALVISEIRATPEESLDIEIVMPWGNHKLREVLAYPFWNMSYHEGQINYLASMLGCLP